MTVASRQWAFRGLIQRSGVLPMTQIGSSSGSRDYISFVHHQPSRDIDVVEKWQPAAARGVPESNQRARAAVSTCDSASVRAQCPHLPYTRIIRGCEPVYMSARICASWWSSVEVAVLKTNSLPFPYLPANLPHPLPLSFRNLHNPK